jgi:hypothetical protein
VRRETSAAAAISAIAADYEVVHEAGPPAAMTSATPPSAREPGRTSERRSTMRTTEAPRLCDTYDMVIVHRAFRREFTLLPDMVMAVRDGDTDRWAATAGPDQRAELAGLLTRLRDGLDEHLTDEEAHILPVVEVTIPAAQWEELGERGIASVPKPRLLVILGYMLEDTTPEEAAAFLGHVPLPGRVGYRLVGRRKFERASAAERRDLAAAER